MKKSRKKKITGNLLRENNKQKKKKDFLKSCRITLALAIGLNY